MLTAMPEVLFPSLAADRVPPARTCWPLYAAGTVGGVVATTSSGWTARVHRRGRAIVVAARRTARRRPGRAARRTSGWPIGLSAAGSGGHDQRDLRQTVWNQTIPDELRGRLAGVEMLSYSIGPLGGQVRAGVVADATSVRASIVSGGIACMALVTLTAASLPSFWRYDARADQARRPRARAAPGPRGVPRLPVMMESGGS